MKTQIITEDVLKGAFYSLRELRGATGIHDPELKEVVSKLSNLIEKEQEGKLH